MLSINMVLYLIRMNKTYLTGLWCWNIVWSIKFYYRSGKPFVRKKKNRPRIFFWDISFAKATYEMGEVQQENWNGWCFCLWASIKSICSGQRANFCQPQLNIKDKSEWVDINCEIDRIVYAYTERFFFVILNISRWGWWWWQPLPEVQIRF